MRTGIFLGIQKAIILLKNVFSEVYTCMYAPQLCGCAYHRNLFKIEEVTAAWNLHMFFLKLAELISVVLI